MATVRFITKGKGEHLNILVRFKHGTAFDLVRKTGLIINQDYWSVKTNTIRQKASFKGKVKLDIDLKELERIIFQRYNEDLRKDKEIDGKWLDKCLLTWQNRNDPDNTDFLADLFVEYKNSRPDKVSSHTIQNLNTTVMHLVKFEQAERGGTKVRITDVDLAFKDSYEEFCKVRCGYSLNTIAKDLQQIKTVCFYARDKGFDISPQLMSRSFKIEKGDSKIKVTLNLSELQAIFNHQFEQDYLSNARDWLVVGCYTACRVKDLMNLTSENVFSHPSGRKIIQYKQSKTGTLVAIPLHPHIEQILEKNKGEFPRKISDVKFNKYIKIALEKVGIRGKVLGTKRNPKTHRNETGHFPKYQLFCAHDCRRSFATNFYSKLSNKDLMKITGHLSEKQFLAYVGETESDHVDNVGKMFEKTVQDQSIQLNTKIS